MTERKSGQGDVCLCVDLLSAKDYDDNGKEKWSRG